MKIAHVTNGLVRLLFVMVALQPPPFTVGPARTLPTVTQKFTVPGVGGTVHEGSVAVLDRVSEERFLGGHQVPKIRFHRGDVRLRLGVRELRDRDGGQNADDHHHDQELDQRETLAVHCHYPLQSVDTKGATPTIPASRWSS